MRAQEERIAELRAQGEKQALEAMEKQKADMAAMMAKMNEDMEREKAGRALEAKRRMDELEAKAKAAREELEKSQRDAEEASVDQLRKLSMAGNSEDKQRYQAALWRNNADQDLRQRARRRWKLVMQQTLMMERLSKMRKSMLSAKVDKKETMAARLDRVEREFRQFESSAKARLKGMEKAFGGGFQETIREQIGQTCERLGHLLRQQYATSRDAIALANGGRAAVTSMAAKLAGTEPSSTDATATRVPVQLQPALRDLIERLPTALEDESLNPSGQFKMRMRVLQEKALALERALKADNGVETTYGKLVPPATWESAAAKFCGEVENMIQNELDADTLMRMPWELDEEIETDSPGDAAVDDGNDGALAGSAGGGEDLPETAIVGTAASSGDKQPCMFTFHDALQGLYAHIGALLEAARVAALGCCTANLDANFAQAQGALSQMGEQLMSLQGEQARLQSEADLLRQDMVAATSELRQVSATMSKSNSAIGEADETGKDGALRAELEAAIASLTSMVNMKANAVSLGELERLLADLQSGVHEMQKSAPNAELVEKLRKALKEKADRGEMQKIMRRLDGLASLSRDTDDPAASVKTLRCLACDKPLPLEQQPPIPGEPPELTLEPSLDAFSSTGASEYGPFRERPKSSSAADRRRKLGSGPLGVSGRPLVGTLPGSVRPIVGTPGNRDGSRSMKEAERLRKQAIQYGERPLHEQMMRGVPNGALRPVQQGSTISLGGRGLTQGSQSSTTVPYSEQQWADQGTTGSPGPPDMSIGGSGIGKKSPARR